MNLIELAERVEGYSPTGHYDLDRDAERELNEQIGLAIGVGHRRMVGDPALGNERWAPTPLKPYATSLDAAMSLVPEGWSVNLFTPGAYVNRLSVSLKHPNLNPGGSGQPILSHAATPALALCAAALRARASHTGEEQ